MKFMKKVTQRLLQARAFGRLLKEDGLINTTDLLVATGATVVLAAGVGAAVIGTLDDAKYGKAQPDAQAIAAALSDFYSDTGKWPGQAEQAGAATGTDAKPATFLVTAGVAAADATVLPTDYAAAVGAENGTAISVRATTCQNNSLEGFVGASIAAGTLATATKLNLNDYLVRKPSEAAYSNWQGPYLQAEIRTDPWDKAWVLNLQSLYCSEQVVAGGSAGTLGYAWALAGGTNRTISTALAKANLDPTGDDAGVNLGKLVTRGTGGADAQ